MRLVVVHDPKALQTIMIKDQESWPKGLEPSKCAPLLDHSCRIRQLIELTVFYSDLNMLLGPGVLTTEGDQHKRQRKLLNPVFSVAHLRDMTHIFYKVAHRVCIIELWRP